MGYATCWGGVVLGWLPTNVYAACSGGVVGLSSGDVDSCGDVPQYKVMKYLVFGIISTSLLFDNSIPLRKNDLLWTRITYFKFLEYRACRACTLCLGTRKRVPDRETPPHPLTCFVTPCMYCLYRTSEGRGIAPFLAFVTDNGFKSVCQLKWVYSITHPHSDVHRTHPSSSSHTSGERSSASLC